MNPADRLEPLCSFKTDLSPEETKTLDDYRKSIRDAFRDEAFGGYLPVQWFSFLNRGLLGYNHEIFNAFDRKIPDPVKRFRASLNYGYFYRALGLEGVALSRLNLYVTKLCGSREYHPLLDNDLKKTLYPLLYFNDILDFTRDTNEALWTLSVFREESHFNKNSISQAGAAGVAQLMPSSADIIKKNMKEPDYNCYDFRDNLEIGAFHIKYLLKKYRHNYFYALAAYNAGEPAVNRWKKKYKYDNELWIESIDYDETWEYIRRIVQTRYFYSLFYGFGPVSFQLTN
jgi:hypothetical protein